MFAREDSRLGRDVLEGLEIRAMDKLSDCWLIGAGCYFGSAFRHVCVACVCWSEISTDVVLRDGGERKSLRLFGA
jgi:hypothetical protein